jgi:hypothetical protein
MRFFCTIYNQAGLANGMFRGTNNASFEVLRGRGTDVQKSRGGSRLPDVVSRVGTVEVSGKDRREAAARAWIDCVGRSRAQLLLERLSVPRQVAALEADLSAIAPSLRKTPTEMGDGYTMDNVRESWLIMVEPLPRPEPQPAPVSHTRRQKKPSRSRRLRISHSTLCRLLRSPSPN